MRRHSQTRVVQKRQRQCQCLVLLYPKVSRSSYLFVVAPRSETGDARVLPILEALTAFFEGQDVVTAGYTLEGRHLANFSHLSFTAPVCCLFKVSRRRNYCRASTIVR